MSNTFSFMGLDAMMVLHRSRILALIFLSALLGLFSARLTWLIIDPAGTVSEVRPLPGFDLPIASADGLYTDISILSRSNPFAASESEIADIVPDAPVTNLNLTLKGVRASDDAALSSAIIVTPDNRSDAYGPGDEIIESVVLERVLSDRVILSKEGAFESLLLDGRKEELSVLSRPGEDPREISGQRIDDAAPAPQNEIDPSAILAAMTLSPEQDESGLIGYRLSPRDDGTAMRALGFQPGDLLVEFDGDAVGDFEPADISDKLNNSDRISLAVEREDQKVPLTLALSKRNAQ